MLNEIDSIDSALTPGASTSIEALENEVVLTSEISDSDSESVISIAESEPSSSDSCIVQNCKSNDKFKVELSQWCINHNITSMAIDDLLKLFRSNISEVQLPLSSKTLLQTPKTDFYTIIKIGGGEYYHFGLEYQLSNLLNFKMSPSSELEVMLSIDGLPLSKSSKKQFWPILGICRMLSESPFIIGLFFSCTSKPSSVEEFLLPLVQEFSYLKANGFWQNFCKYTVIIKCLIADAPARNFVKCCSAFNGYSGCDRCVQKGNWSGRVIFRDSFAPLRTDFDFVNKTDQSHHAGTSPLLQLEIGLVSDIVLDYMHLVCLGVVKKLLVCWKRGPLPHREGRQFINLVSERLVNLRKYIPTEFNRKTRTLLELDFWKATEFRSFLLYTGPLVLKNCLNVEKYQHFLHLSLAIRILLSDDRNWYKFADSLLKVFVSKIPVLYTEDFLVYNIHSLVHLTDDAVKFGSLNNINAFPFENFMQVLKRMLREKNRELPQIIRRVSERQQLFYDQKVEKKVLKISKDLKDRGWMLSNGDIILIIKSDDTTISFRKFLKKIEFFTVPCQSSKFNIYELSNISPKVYQMNKSSLNQKLLMFPLSIINDNSTSFVCFPMC
jgi:hypothetical protein